MANFKPAKIKREEAIGMQELMARFLISNGLHDGMYQKAVFDAWDRLSGLSSYTSNKYLKNNILYVTISSSTLRSMMRFQLNGIKDAINAELSSDRFLGTLSENGVTSAEIKDIILR